MDDDETPAAWPLTAAPDPQHDTVALPEAGRHEGTAPHRTPPSRRDRRPGQRTRRAGTAGAAWSPTRWAVGGLVAVVLLGWAVLRATSGDAPATSPGSPAAGRTSAGGASATGGSGVPATGGQAPAMSTSPGAPTSPSSGPASGPSRPAGDQALVAAPIVGIQSGKCVEAAGGTTADLTPIELARCDDGAAQAISYTSVGELRVLGKCLDAKGAGTGNGTPIVLFTCNAQPNQKWHLGSDATIRGAQSNLCLDATGFGTADGTPLQLWSCTGGTNQAWNS